MLARFKPSASGLHTGVRRLPASMRPVRHARRPESAEGYLPATAPTGDLDTRAESSEASSSGTTVSNSKPGSGPDNSGGGFPVKFAAAGGVLLGLGILIGATVLYKDQIRVWLAHFSGLIDDMGPWGIVVYCVMYTLLELVAVPAIPLTMTAGALFGVVPGTIAVSVSATCAATLSFLIARYAARDKVTALIAGNPKFHAIDKALEKNSLQVVTLLRLSPLLPFALGNYLYGLTSVRLGPYVFGSWLGMLPGTFAYVNAGKYGREILEGGAQGGMHMWQVGLGLGATVLAMWYIGRMANDAMKGAIPPESDEGGANSGGSGSSVVH